ncbi:MAG: histidinol dehydrogenase, partial [Corynebacterium sp.]|nr:histidinol dehydrogenase [Corynebacterium sp.]
MLSRLDLRGQTPSTAELRRILPRGGTDIDHVLPAVTPVVAAVRDRGAEAALADGEPFDHVRPPSVRVPEDVIAAALRDLAPKVTDALREAVPRVR